MMNMNPPRQGSMPGRDPLSSRLDANARGNHDLAHLLATLDGVGVVENLLDLLQRAALCFDRLRGEIISDSSAEKT